MVKSSSFAQSRQFKALQGLVGLVLSWFLFLKAVDTGSLQQYGLLILLLGICINRLFRAALPKKQ